MTPDVKWQEVRLGDLVQVKHGWPFKSKLFSEALTGRPIVVNIGNFNYSGGFRFDSTTLKEYSGDYPPEYLLIAGDILVVMTCQTPGGEILGVPARIPADGRTYLHNQRLGKLVVRSPNQISIDYLYWLFLWPQLNRALCATSSGTKILHTAPTRIEEFRFKLPPFAEQQRIGGFLNALGDKIELNRRMNQTLEATARAIFEAWFAEQERLPAGWAQGTLGDVTLNPRRVKGPSAIPRSTHYIGLEHMPRKSIALADWASAELVESSKFEFRAKELLFGKLRPYFHKVGVAPVDGVCSTDILVISPKQHAYWGLVLFVISSEKLVQYTERAAAGTKMPRTNWADIARFQIRVPPVSVAADFNKLVEPTIDKIIANIHQARTLTTLRDFLLPKLLSGEIRVRDAEKIAESAL